MRSPSFVSGTTVWAATLCSGVEISSFGDVRDPHAGDACPQRLPPRRTPGAPQLGLPPLRPYPARSSAVPPGALQLSPGTAAPLRPAPRSSALRPQLSPEPRSFGPAGDMRRAVHPPPRRLAMAGYRSDAFTKGPRREKSQFVATYCLHAFKYS